MPDCKCDHLERIFNTKAAADDLRDYRRKGPDPSTALLIGALRDHGVEGRTLLDIGGGVGAIQLELLAAGLASTTDVDVSAAYLEVAQREAASRGLSPRTAYRQGDFVAVADEVEPADLVTLDRVICCYADLDALVRAAADRTRVRMALVHPYDYWWVRAGATLINLVTRPFGGLPIRIHRTANLEAILRAAGLELEWTSGARFWRVAVYRRATRVT